MSNQNEVTIQDVKEMSIGEFMGFFQRRAGAIYSLAYATLGARADLRSWMVEPDAALGQAPIELIMEQGSAGVAKVKDALEKKAETDKSPKGPGKR